MNLIDPVTPELSLQIGIANPQGDQLVITPPAQTLFDQLRAPLSALGNYLAMLLDESKAAAVANR